MRFHRLPDWLAWQETCHHTPIDLDLERVARVADRLGLNRLPFPILSIAGTNGKGSGVALLESIFTRAGYRVGTHTSPHLLRYNERVRLAGREASDEALVRAFHEIDRARGPTTLTYFEFGALAAMWLFRRAGPDVAVLEVGLGGRLDAVNVFDADIALITTIDLDHQAWLGNDREAIGREKAGIYRAGRPAVCGDPAPPASVRDHARAMGAPWYCAGRDFRAWEDPHAPDRWHWESRLGGYRGLPNPALAGGHQRQNAAGALMVLALLRDRLPVPQEAVRRGLAGVTLPGRFQVSETPEGVTRILDVAHNPQAARALARLLREKPRGGRTLAVVAMLEDKDREGVLRAMEVAVHVWYAADLDVPRGGTAKMMAATLSRSATDARVHTLPGVPEAYHAALQDARPGDRIVVFGSFYTVGIVSRLMAEGG
uniref:Dihydrofolate synthase/folylpolyglutamate synthase n=1 Tax=Candidatus Kentrum eta TaxID=2126337 RepID=A0A450UJQ9_9GAMM|nr:MAG: dihydrofolate synthase / folylpolyglutamate synthase [Candidatus Kentron sp. H]VFJ92763.1 MAG: dihydrofolate synthase / folylpolyglutamate synthase [Candidatus Kentron sp. H]VFJ97567.1 MAG: dihydrofolate synthase / folylpolyglutamate synthase [Candidatus Kentron sp. H]